MPLTDSDKALRRLVADLAMTTPEDMAAVLALLDARTAAQVRSMLAAYANVDDIFDVEPAPAPINTSGLSEWLAARTLGKALRGLDAYRMTPQALEVLRDIAVSMPSQLELAGAAGRSIPAARQDAVKTRVHSLFGRGTSA